LSQWFCGPLAGLTGGLRRGDLRRNGRPLGIESNAQDIAGNRQLARLTDAADRGPPVGRAGGARPGA
jgi:hypothetical protein